MYKKVSNTGESIEKEEEEKKKKKIFGNLSYMLHTCLKTFGIWVKYYKLGVGFFVFMLSGNWPVSWHRILSEAIWALSCIRSNLLHGYDSDGLVVGINLKEDQDQCQATRPNITSLHLQRSISWPNIFSKLSVTILIFFFIKYFCLIHISRFF